MNIGSGGSGLIVPSADHLYQLLSDCFTSQAVYCFVAFLTEEKKSTLQDMASQRGVACRAQGWKIHLCAAQLRQLVSVLWSDCITQ